MTARREATSLETRVAARLARLVARDSTCVVAVSGGPDSLALLDLLHRTAQQHLCSLVVGHIDHGIDPASDVISERVATAATERRLPFHVRRLHLGPATSETRARKSRRAALRDIATEVDATAIVLAHHADDQAETVLLRLLRGSGPAGLAGMAARHGPWVRPLLGIRRDELARYLESHDLSAWRDPANSDPRHLRSWLRMQLLPLVHERMPDVVDRLLQAASQAAAARTAWQELLTELTDLDVRRTQRGISVAAPVLQGYRSALRHAILAGIGREIGLLLGVRRLAAIDRMLERGSGHGRVSLAAAFHAELAFGRLTFYRNGAAAVEPVVLMPGKAAEIGSAAFAVRVEPALASSREGWSATLLPGVYTARPWRPGDRIRPLGGAGTRPVAVLLREAKIAPALRSTWPVVVDADDATIVWVPGICRADARVPQEGTEAWRVECALS